MKDRDELRKAMEDLGPGYELIREIGRGATAIVYLVRDSELERDLAVKVIRSTFAHDEEAVARLQREARLVARLQHPNIVRVFSTRHLPDGSLALLMEHVPGQNLKEVLRTAGPFTPARTLGVLRDVASALAYAHRRRIVHRDVKPENIYVDDEVGTARLADFGIARPWDRDARLTVPGEALGTPAYMSPEQIDGDDVDGRTDVYSLGLVGYEMLAGEHPWEGDNLFTIIFKQKNEELPALQTVRSDLPAELVRVLEGALRKDPDRRWDSAEVFLRRLNAVQLPGASVASPEAVEPGAAELAPHAKPRRDVEPESRAGSLPRWRTGRVAAVAALVLLALGAWTWTAWWGNDGEGWVSLGEALPGVRPEGEAGPASREPSGGGAAPDAPGALRPVADETPAGGTVGATVPLTFRLSDPADSTTRVRFRVVEGGGVLDPRLAAPGGDGVVRTSLRLPDRPGATTVAAAPDGREDQEVRVRLVATPGLPQQVVAVVGQSQVGEAGAFLPRDLGVRVVDALGNPVPDTEVRFQVLVGDGSVAPARVRTDTAGRAFARWRLGTDRGDQRAAALVPAAEEATFVFRAVAQGTAAGTPPAETPADTILRPAGEPPREPTAGPERPEDAETDTAAGEASLPEARTRVVPVPLAVGGTHVCVVGARGFPECLGALDPDSRGEAVRVRLTAVASGVSHACGLDTTGAAFCWGANDSGQLGDGGRTDRATPTAVRSSPPFSRLALGLAHSCGLDGGGRVHCWGRNVNGQLGDGSRDDRPVPRPVAGPATMVDVVAGWNHGCALDASGRAWCWGLNSDGQLGDGSRIDRVRPTPVGGSVTFSALAAGSAHTCGLGDGIVRCWGGDGSGQLGIGGAGSQGEPIRLESLPGTVVQLVAGARHACALLRDGEARCWGQNIHGQLGDGSTTDRGTPVPVSGELSFRSLSAGGASTCGVTNDGDRYCWGLNQSGQLGDGTRTNRATPTRVGRAS